MTDYHTYPLLHEERALQYQVAWHIVGATLLKLHILQRSSEKRSLGLGSRSVLRVPLPAGEEGVILRRLDARLLDIRLHALSCCMC